MGDVTNTGKLSIRRKPGKNGDESATDEEISKPVAKRRKRVVILETKAKAPKQNNQPPAQNRKRKPKVKPSVIRSSELNKALSAHSKAWRANRPLSHDIEKQVFRFISARHLSASKRVVKALIKKQTSAINYLKNSEMDAPVYNLDDEQSGLVSWERASIAAKLLVRVEAEREAAKRTKKQRKAKK